MPARRHHEILAAARALVVETRYSAVTMERVAARSGVGKPTLYRWWPNRAALVHEALVEVVASQPLPDTGSIADDLRRLVRGVLAFFADPLVGAAWLGAVAELQAEPAQLAAAHRRFLAPVAEAMRDRFARAAERGECRADVDPQLVLDVIIGAGATALVVPERRPGPDERADQLVRLVLEGIA